MAGAIAGLLGRVCLSYSTRYPRLPVEPTVEVRGGRRAAFRAPDKSEASRCRSRSDRNLRRLTRRADCTHFRPWPTLGKSWNLGIDPPKMASSSRPGKETRTVDPPAHLPRDFGMRGTANLGRLRTTFTFATLNEHPGSYPVVRACPCWYWQ
jgi:hypothetical protein